jgi:hypothetical protein
VPWRLCGSALSTSEPAAAVSSARTTRSNSAVIETNRIQERDGRVGPPHRVAIGCKRSQWSSSTLHGSSRRIACTHGGQVNLRMCACIAPVHKRRGCQHNSLLELAAGSKLKNRSRRLRQQSSRQDTVSDSHAGYNLAVGRRRRLPSASRRRIAWREILYRMRDLRCTSNKQTNKTTSEIYRCQ